MSQEEQSKYGSMILRVLDGQMSEEKYREFDTKLREDASFRRYYLQFMEINASLNAIDKFPITRFGEDEEVLDRELWLELAQHEKKAQPIQIPDQPLQRERIQKVVYPPREKRHLSKSGIFSIAACAAAVLFFVYLRFAPQQPSSVQVATVVDQINVQWLQTDVKFNNGTRLWTNKNPLNLNKGIVKIHYDEGVDVMIEGPAVFEIERSGIYMEYGRLYSRVSDTGLGFMVRTPTSQFFDLGTEFGIQADINGSSELHVIKGKVQVFAGTEGKSRVSQIVTENGAVKYNANLNQVKNISIEKHAFVRQIDSQSNFIWRGQTAYNLADVVGGGDGFGKGQINLGIDHEGQTTLLDNIVAYTQPIPFTSVSSNPFVNGIFVPYGLTQIDSLDNGVYDFGATSGKFYLGVLNGAWHKQKDNAVPRHPLRLGGMEYGTYERPAIYIHANQGITFDLQAIRDYTGMEIDSFKSICGVSETYAEYAEAIRKVRQYQDIQLPKASFYVLVDSRERFVRKEMTHLDGPAVIQVDIAPEDRLLTLVTTEGSDKNDGDWTLFGEPTLMLRSE